MHHVAVGSIALGKDQPLTLIAGPSVIENEAHTLETASTLKHIASKCDVPIIFKASFDKANRTSIESYRGPGIDDGLAILAKVKQDLGLPILTDVHEASQARSVAKVADVLQIPAFLSRQTDLLLACAATERVVNIKKGQFLAPLDVRHIVEKLTKTGRSKILLTERGTSFGYNNLVVDMRSFPILRSFGFPVIFDVSHSVQLPGGGNGVSEGEAQYIKTLACAGVAAGVDGVFMEVHQNPAEARSDGANALRLESLEPLLRQLVDIDRISRRL